MSAPSVFRCSIPRTALEIGKVGSISCAFWSVRLRRPPGYPVYRVYYLPRSFAPLTLTLAALITTTWSPVFRCGVNVGLCLPRKILATLLARRPSTWSVASTTNQSPFRSAAFAVHVFCLLIRCLVNHFHQCQAPGGGRLRRQAPVPRSQYLSHPFRSPAPAPYLCQRACDAAGQSSQKPFRHQLQLDEIASPHDLCAAHLAQPGVRRLRGRAVARPIVPANQRLRRLRHRIDVEPGAHVPAAPSLKAGPGRPVQVALSLPPPPRRVPSVEVIRNHLGAERGHVVR